MNYRFIGTITAATLAFASCSKQASTQTEEESPKAVATPTPRAAEVAATAPPAATPALATPAPGTPAPARELAPDGVFYLVVAARVETPDGIQGLPPGTGVKLVRPGIYLSSAGEVALKPEQLTNDMAVARTARDAAQAAQAAMHPRGAAEAATPAVQARPNPAKSQPNAAAAAALAADRQRLQTQISGLKMQLAETDRQLQVLTEKRAKEMSERINKGRMIASTTDQQLANGQAQSATLRNQILAAELELANKR